jgi:DNA repair exonuclease SbcCD ATPase subunit
MKLLNLEIENVRGIRHVKILAKQINEIAGPNGAGKTTVLDAVKMLFCGKRASGIKPLRNYEETGKIKGIVGDENGERFIATRKFDKNGESKLTIVPKDGTKRGQDELDELINKKTLDPLYFDRLSSKEKFGAIQSMAPDGFLQEMGKLNGEVLQAEEERKDAKKDLAKIGKIPKVESVAEVDVSALMAEMQENEKHNARQRTVADKLARDRQTLQAMADKIAEQAKQFEILKKEIESTPEPQPIINLDGIAAKISQAGEANKAAQAYAEYQRRVAEQVVKAQSVEEWEAKVSDLHVRRKDLQAKISLPVDGLTFDENNLWLNGVPYPELSASERIRLSTKIAMSLNPELRILFVQDGSNLDQQSYKEVETLAMEKDYQLWIETVGAGHGSALILRAGEVVEGEALEALLASMRP